MGELKQHQPPMTIEEQVKNLKDIGLIVDDEEQADEFQNSESSFEFPWKMQMIDLFPVFFIPFSDKVSEAYTAESTQHWTWENISESLQMVIYHSIFRMNYKSVTEKWCCGNKKIDRRFGKVFTAVEKQSSYPQQSWNIPENNTIAFVR